MPTVVLLTVALYLTFIGKDSKLIRGLGFGYEFGFRDGAFELQALGSK